MSKPITAKVVLSGFELLAKGIRKEDYLATPELVAYVKANFEMRYCPENMIAALGLRFSYPEMNDTTAEKKSKLVAATEVLHVSA